MEAPDKIYLQVKDEDGNELDPLKEWITWAENRIYDTDIAYIKVAEDQFPRSSP